MSLKGMLIAPFATGLDMDMEPWLTPPDSFRELENIHIKHGYLQKREGYRPAGWRPDGEGGMAKKLIGQNPRFQMRQSYGG